MQFNFDLELGHITYTQRRLKFQRSVRRDVKLAEASLANLLRRAVTGGMI